jgi:hypothetical protein
MTERSRSQLIEEFAVGAQRVRDAWEAVPEDARALKPAPGEWSPIELVIHITDADVNGYVRFRKLVAEPGAAVAGYAQDAWAESLHYSGQDPQTALQLMAGLRALTHPLLEGLTEEQWAHRVTHSERGEWSMDDWLRTYTSHVDAHLAQMHEAVEAWKGLTTR